jgi:hypothetical protein
MAGRVGICGGRRMTQVLGEEQLAVYEPVRSAALGGEMGTVEFQSLDWECWYSTEGAGLRGDEGEIIGVVSVGST